MTNMNIFLNELSFIAASEKKDAYDWMKQLYELFKSAFSNGFDALHTPREFKTTRLTCDYSILDWLNDPCVERDMRLLFKTKISKYPYTEDILAQKEENEKQPIEFTYKDKNAIGLGAAYLFDTLSLSLNSSMEWDVTTIEIQVTKITGDDQLTQSCQRVVHASKPYHLQKHSQWIEKKKRIPVKNGIILWEKRKERFPHLEFCENVKDQLYHLSGHEEKFDQILKRLDEFENYCSKEWKSGSFQPDMLPSKTTGESETRCLKFKKELTFICPDGKSGLFSWHVRFTPGHGRIYFQPDNEKRMFYIGYIGWKIE